MAGSGGGGRDRLTGSRLNKPIELTEEDVLEVQAQAPPTTNFSRILADGHREERAAARPSATQRKFTERNSARRGGQAGERSPGPAEDTSPPPSQPSPLLRLPPRLQKLLGEVPAPVRYSTNQRSPSSLVPRGSQRDVGASSPPPSGGARGSPISGASSPAGSPVAARTPENGGNDWSPGSEGPAAAAVSEYVGGMAGTYPSSSNIPRASVGKIVMVQRPVEERSRVVRTPEREGAAATSVAREVWAAGGGGSAAKAGAGAGGGTPLDGSKDGGGAGSRASGATTPGARGVGGGKGKKVQEERQSDLGLYSGTIAGWDEQATAGGSEGLDLGGLPIASSDWN